MLHDKFLPEFHFSEKHQILITAPAENIFSNIIALNASSSWIIRSLLFLRGIPPSTGNGIDSWKKMGFVLLDQENDKEIILGLIGQFWKVKGNIQRCSPEEFLKFRNPEFAKATWNFEIIPRVSKQCILQTETRIHCGDENTRKNFGRYWKFIQPFSGIIRLEMLKAIRKNSENVKVRFS